MKRIKTALISVFYKDGLEPLIEALHSRGVTIYSTGGTQTFIEGLDVPVHSVESLTGYPSILDGRVKTLHPKVFGGILARREEGHLEELRQFEIPQIDLVIVDLYPFAETVKESSDQRKIIEKIDIGGISLIRAAAKNFNDVAIIAGRQDYGLFLDMYLKGDGTLSETQRKKLATRAFEMSASYDAAIWAYFSGEEKPALPMGLPVQTLRYGENPHQSGKFYGALEDMLEQLHGKALSYNNLIDVDAAVNLMSEFQQAPPTFAVIKHTNACGLATKGTLKEAWEAALAGDPVSAFGGILICNQTINTEVAAAIDKIFYEVLIAPDFTADALELLRKKQRILLKIKHYQLQPVLFKTVLNGLIEQAADMSLEDSSAWQTVTEKVANEAQIEDLSFALKAVKHLKSNAIVLVKNGQLIGMGCGQTSRVEALQQAVHKAKSFGHDTKGSVMASDAFFPFPDCVEIGSEAGVSAIIQPGGSKNDQASIAEADKRGLAMVMTGVRHFKH